MGKQKERYVLKLIGFIETILYYIYKLPIKIARINTKYNLKCYKADEVSWVESNVFMDIAYASFNIIQHIVQRDEPCWNYWVAWVRADLAV